MSSYTGKRAFSESELFLIAGSVWLGAYLAFDVPLLPSLALLAVSLFVQSKICVAVALIWLASALGANANAEYEKSVASGPVDERLIVVGDARPVGAAGINIELRFADGRRVEAVGYGETVSEIRSALIGSSFEVTGSLKPVGNAPWLRTRHIVGRLSLDQVSGKQPASVWWQPSEFLRQSIVAGAKTFNQQHSNLYTGLVIGDDRFQTADQEAEFRSAGMAHLLAVSGQNVAFVLAVLSPILFRLRRSFRWVVIVLALLLFAIATRAEPSVLRATVSAGLATSLSLLGLRASGIRILSIVVIALLFADPFLARSVGFQLSVSASFGILVLTPLFNAPSSLPGFIWAPLSVTCGAQIAVAPVLLAIFGEVPLASIPANLVVGWAAGIVMMWGLTVGLIAGLLPVGIAGVMQWPVTILLQWIGSVAGIASDAPIPVIGRSSAFCILGLALLWWGARQIYGMRFILSASLAFGWIALVRSPPSLPYDGDDFLFFPDSNGYSSALIVESAASDRVVGWLVENRVRSVDIVLLEDGGGRSNEIARAVSEVVVTESLLAPSNHRVVGATRVIDRVHITTASTQIVASNRRTTLDITFAPVG